jgi:Tfp pilus assembly protein PilV
VLNAHASEGFTLLEALIASLLLAGALATLAHVVGTGVVQTTSMRRTMAALVLAQSKLEELRALTWRFDADGSRASSNALVASPAGSLSADHAGWVETLDRFGVASAARQPQMYRRRWSIAQWGPDPDTLVLQVCVFESSDNAVAPAPQACVSTIRTRRP